MFDSNWYPRISYADKIPVLYPDSANLEVEKLNFLSNKIENPNLLYKDIDPDTLVIRTNRLEELKKDILSTEENTAVKALYLDKITEELERVQLYRSVLDKDTEQFFAATARVFGNPKQSIWQEILTRLQTRKNYSEAKTPQLYHLISHYRFDHKTTSDEIIRTPEPSDISNLQKGLFALFPFLQLDTKHDELEASQIVEIFNQALINIGAEGWSSELADGSRTAICVLNRKKTVQVPKARKVNAQELTKLIAHEICTHVYRSTVAEKSPLQLLRFGLDHYLMTEEGIATTNEQILSGKFKDFSGDDKYFAIGLVHGLDGVKRDFRAVYEIMREYYFLKFPSKDPEYIQEKAWNVCVRIFRGTPPAHKGVCYTKDIIYREGNIKIWQLLIENPAMYPHLFFGKYDPTNLTHIAALTELRLL